METKKEENMKQSDSAVNVAEQPREIKNSKYRIWLAIAAVILILVGLFAGYVLGVIGYIKVIGPYFSKLEYQRAMEEYLKPYKEDFVGGNTPEETVDLFIDALKKEDYELASRYFVVGEQEVWEKDFKESKRENIEKWIIELENNKSKWRKEQQGENQFVIKYNTGKGEEEITNFIVLKKNVNNKWKIGSF